MYKVTGDDDWEPPTEYHQVALVGGWVADISPADYRNLCDVIRVAEAVFFTCDDIYGGEVMLHIGQIAAVRQHSPTVAARYRLAHEDDED